MSKKKSLYKILKWTGSLLLLAVVSTWMIVSVFREDIQQGIISSLENEYGFDVDYTQTSLVLWKSFPNLSLRVEDFVLAYRDSSRPAMLDVSGFYASVSLPSLISGRYSIKEILIENGQVNVHLEDLSGSSGNESFKSGAVDLGLLKMKEVQLCIGSNEQPEMLNILLQDAILKIEDEKGRLSAELLAEAVPHFALTYLENILGGEQHKIRLKAHFDPGKNNLNIHNGSLNISGNEFLLNFDLGEETYSLVLEGKEGNMAELRPLFTEYLQEFEREGTLNGKMKTRLAFSAKYSDQIPEIVVDFKLYDAEVKLLNDLHFLIDKLSAQFHNNASENVSDFELSIEDFSLHNDFMNLLGQAHLSNFDAPMIKLNTQSEILLNKLPSSIADSLPFEIAQGILFLQTSWERKRPGWEALRPQDLVYSRMQSKYELRSVTIKDPVEDDLLQLIKSVGSFNNNDLLVDSLHWHKGKNTIALQASFPGFFSFLLMPQKGESYQADVHAKAGVLYPEDLLMGVEENQSNSLELYPGFSVLAKIEADSLIYHKFKASGLGVSLNIKQNEWQADSLEFSAWHGKNEIKARLNRVHDVYDLEAEAMLQGVNVKQMFYELENFGQEAIGFRNVDGMLDASLHIESKLDDDFHFLEDSLTAIAELSIIHGRLSDFEPLLNALSFLDEEALRQIDFDTLKNSIEIRERKVYIPTMDILSSLMDFTGYGIHGFDNQIDYHMRILLSEVLSGKARDKKTNFGDFAYVEDDGLGRTSLFLRITGNLSDPVFDYDRKAVARKIKDDFIREKRNFAEALKKEFHWLSRDSQKKQQAEKRKEWIRKQEEGKFIFEWDADSTNEIEQK